MIGVTGANGYVGGRILAHLRAAGIDAVAMVRRPGPADAKARPYALDTPLEASLLEDIELVVHAAYDVSPRGSRLREVNVSGTLPLLEGLAARGARMVLVSSLSAFAGTRSQYGRSKLELEREVLERGGVALRPGLIFGAGARGSQGGLFGAMVAAVSRRSLVPLIGGGRQRMFVTHDRRLCELIAAIAGGRVSSEGPLFAAHEVPTSVRAIAAQIAQAHGRRLRAMPVPGSLAELGLRCGELAHLGLPFRSDSVRSLMNPIPLDEVAVLARSGVAFPALTPELWAEPQVDPEAQLDR